VTRRQSARQTMTHRAGIGAVTYPKGRELLLDIQADDPGDEELFRSCGQRGSRESRGDLRRGHRGQNRLLRTV
jgi:hypothetical protein